VLYVTLGLADLAGDYVNLRYPPRTSDHRRASTKGHVLVCSPYMLPSSVQVFQDHVC